MVVWRKVLAGACWLTCVALLVGLDMPSGFASGGLQRSPRPPRPARRFLAITAFSPGRFSNHRQSMLEAVALARFTSRELLLPPLRACPLTPVDEIFDLRALAAAGVLAQQVAVDSVNGSLASACAGAVGQRIAVASGKLSPRLSAEWIGVLGPTIPWAGMNWSLQSDFSSAKMSLLACHAQAADSAHCTGDPRDAPVYSELMPWSWARSTTLGDFGDVAMPWWLRDAGADAVCALLSKPYFYVNMVALPGAYEAAVRDVRPLPWVISAAREWFASHALEPHRVIALHLRLTDMAFDIWSKFSAACHHAATNASGFAPKLAQLTQFVASMALERAPLILASDDLGSPCVAVLQAHFASLTRVVVLRELGAADSQPWANGSPINDCVSALFLQEVLSQSAAFIGMHASSFSGAIHQNRIVRFHYSFNSSLLLE